MIPQEIYKLKSILDSFLGDSKKDLDVVIEEAKMYGEMVLVMDEIHRLHKDKQDVLLPQLESGLITLIGLTNANPFHSINPAIRNIIVDTQIIVPSSIPSSNVFTAKSKIPI